MLVEVVAEDRVEALERALARVEVALRWLSRRRRVVRGGGLRVVLGVVQLAGVLDEEVDGLLLGRGAARRAVADLRELREEPVGLLER